MTVRAEVTEQLERYDDAAWAALANRGLLRRAEKDLAKVSLRVVAEGEAVDVAVTDWVVRFTTAGPAHATCTCPSGNVCQHIITAGIWLGRKSAPQQRATGAAPAAVPAADAESDDTGDTLHAELMAMDRDSLVSIAGVAGYRWAWQHVADLDIAREVRIETGRQVRITMGFPQVTFRYLGGGPQSLFADQRLPSLERRQVAAVLAYQRVHGVTQEALAPRVSPSGERSQVELAKRRSRFRAVLGSLLTEAVRVGLSHLSPEFQQRFTTLATSAQGAEYHRLALLLRRIADQVAMQLRRSARADGRQLLDGIALAYALLSALEAAAARGAAPRHLVGSARARYDPLRSLELVGLGAVPWHAGSGYHGLTVVFWAPATGAYLTWTDARPSTMPGFDPLRRWTEPGPWPGVTAPSEAVGRRLVLTSPQVSAYGRISGAESTTALVSDLDRAELIRMLPVTESWSALADTHDPSRRSLLDPPDPNAMWAVLRPREFGSPHFDAVRQTMVWPLRDADGAVLTCEAPYARHTAQLLNRIEWLGRTRPLPGTLLVARIRAGGGALAAEPVSLVNPAPHGPAVDCLSFDSAGVSLAAATPGSPGPDHATHSTPAPEVAAAAVPAALPRQLAALDGFLQTTSEHGLGGRAAADFQAQLATRVQRCADIGLTVFGPPDPEVDPTEQLLRSHYLMQQVTHALVGATDPAATAPATPDSHTASPGAADPNAAETR